MLSPMPISRNQVFISYARPDEKWKNLLLQHLAPLMRDDKITVWHDGLIKPGDKWEEEIERALARARVAVLLATPAFLASPFIARREMPPLLGAASNDGLIICWISVKACLYDETPLKDYQAMNNPARPLATFLRSQYRIDEELVRIAKQIRDFLATQDAFALESPQSFTLRMPRVPFRHGRNADFEKFIIPAKARGFTMEVTPPQQPYWRCGFVLAPEEYIRDGRTDVTISQYFLFHIGQGHIGPSGRFDASLPTGLHFRTYYRDRGDQERPFDSGSLVRIHVGIDRSDENITVAFDGQKVCAILPPTYFRHLYILAWADTEPACQVTVGLNWF